jgi:hypothetical protein
MSKPPMEVLIVDPTGQWGPGLRNQLERQRLTACVLVTRRSAIAFARNRSVRAAIVENDEASKNVELSKELRRLGVETVLILSPAKSTNITAAIMRPGHRVLIEETFGEWHSISSDVMRSSYKL